VAIVPDDKDWTWVLDRPCPECGFGAASIGVGEVPDLIRANARRWVAEVLPRSDVHERPEESTWSPLEYACHVRDVFRLYSTRLQLMLDVDDPTFANWDQDDTAVADRYSEQDPTMVGVELAAAAELLAEQFAAVPDDQWSRTGTRSDGVHFTIDSFARYFVHDPIHHLHDVLGRDDRSAS
jgi:hypothetical protein